MKWRESTATSEALLLTGRLRAGWQAACFSTLSAVLAAFLYFGGNVVGYGAPPRLILPPSISGYENCKTSPPVLTIRIASLSGNLSNPAVHDFAWFIPGLIEPLSEADLLEILKNYAADVCPASLRFGLDAETGLSHNLVKLQIDARCPAESYVRLLQIARECGIWQLYFSVQREPCW